MLTGQKGVKYGLQVRAPPGSKPKPRALPAKKSSVFGDESDDDEELNVEQQIARQAARKQTDKKVAELHAAALAEDAAIFDYDGHYDSMQEARAEPKKQEKLQRQSRYIAGLLEKAEERKQEQDVLYERQLAKERAAEDHLFGDKEKFVTAAYRAKLAERQQYLDEQKRKKEAEEADSVEKRGHMGDFYRNLIRSNVAFGGKAAAADTKPAAADTKPAVAAAPEGEQRQEQSGQQGPRRAADPGQAQREMEEALLAEEAAARAAAAGPPASQPGGLSAAKQQDEGGSQQQEQQQQQQPPEPPAQGGNAAVPAAGGAVVGDGGAGGAAAQAAAEAAARRNKEDAVAAARERYLARKRQKTGA